ncbi:MAG TPA: GNAT family N-acetyltransferase [Acetobacteraceae bacterium]|jgi:ribosomal protein S18 acetylase RimI-like enzyme
MFDRATVDDAEALGVMHVQAWRETYAGLMPDSVLAGLDPVRRGQRWRDIIGAGSFVLLLRQGSDIVGFGSAGPQRDARLVQTGEIGALYLLRQIQRRGVGRQMMAALGRSLAERGLMSASLWVLDRNLPARRFYEALGACQLMCETVEQDGQAVSHIAYAWDEVTRLYEGR